MIPRSSPRSSITELRVDQRYNGASPLHYVVKAGFVQTIQVLLERGADREALDDHGRTPLDWLEQAAKSVNRAAVRDAHEDRPSSSLSQSWNQSPEIA